MTDVKRYDCRALYGGDAEMQEDETGEYVSYEDYAAMLAEVAAARRALEIMTQREACDCGCPAASKPIIMKPAHYYAIARDALEEMDAAKHRDAVEAALFPEAGGPKP